MISPGIVTVSYIAAAILFILALGGLSNQESARRGNTFGIIGMVIALLATVARRRPRQSRAARRRLVIGGVDRPRARAGACR